MRAPTHDSYRHLLLHQPPRQWDADPTDVYVKTYVEAPPCFSLVLPVHNQERVIAAMLTSIMQMTLGTFELLVILDGCTDGTPAAVERWVHALERPSNLYHLHVFSNPTGIFETSCDNQGFVLSRGRYIIEIQADMVLYTLGYNVLLASPMEAYPDLLGISGRCCHPINASPGQTVGKMGDNVQKKLKRPHDVLADFSNHLKVFLSHTVNRGPLALMRSRCTRNSRRRVSMIVRPTTEQLSCRGIEKSFDSYWGPR